MPDTSFNFLGLTITASRQGDRVTGEVRFPHETFGRCGAAIDYRSTRPVLDAAPRAAGLVGASPCDESRAASPGPVTSARESFRLSCAKRFAELRAADSSLSQRDAARRVVESVSQRVSIRSVMLWGERLLTQGESSLADGYTPQPQTVETFAADEAEQGVKIAAWWCFRIGNVERIDTRTLHTAVGLVRRGFPLADLLAAIECYYGWPCDRVRYPFKPWARWAKYDVQTWLFRAADQADHRRLQAALKTSGELFQTLSGEVHRRPALDTAPREAGLVGGSPRDESRVACQGPPPPKTRKREVLHRGTRRAIRSLADTLDTAVPPKAGGEAARAKLAPTSPGPTSDLVAAARLARAVGAPSAARQLLADVPVDGPPPLAAVRDPQTVAESLGLMDDAWRRMLLDVSRGDRDADRQAVATMPLWWEMLPRCLRESIEAAVNEWLDLNPRWRRAARAERLGDALDLLVRKRRLDMLRPHLRPDRSGVERIGVALRLSG